MKRIQEKVKDIVEVRSFERLRDFIADPAQTLSNYHFTDATSELMGKWLDKIAGTQVQNGSACALAGYRGVGKSHFIATLGALVSNPELRSRVTDSHVANSAQRLLRRHYPVAYIRRGTHESLLEEFKDAVAQTFKVSADTLPDTLSAILHDACEKSGELPFILMIDTAFERGSRVTRDDGPFLGEIADLAKESNVFVGVALDDDISGADGSNSAISRTFSIDFLDQEHLYKVVNSHVFPKHSQMLPVLHEIYAYFRETVPSFRWSEQRFSSLYPLHPAILEVAPFVRLYVHEFALLGFASEAGERIMGRPANSLIALDEVFDNTENGLRKIEDLQPAFAAYDKLNTDVVGQIPVMQRLQAKLILKALLLLSLDGQGTTAGEICASMLIFDENDPEAAVRNVENLTRTFAEALPDDIRMDAGDGREIRYGFKLKSKDDLNEALAKAAAEVSANVIPQTLRQLMLERFSDCTFSTANDEAQKDLMDCQVEWRGGLRRGRIVWNDINSLELAANLSPQSEAKDWEVVVDFGTGSDKSSDEATETSRVTWRPDALRKGEIEAILRFHALSNNAELREQFSDQVRASVHSHSVSVEQIFERIILGDGKLIIDGFDYNFTEGARTSQTLSDLFTVMLEPLFETRFPAHPYFTKRLGMGEVATLVSDLYSGTRQNLEEVQDLAKTFALPLGLVRTENERCVPESEDVLIGLPLAASVLKLVAESADGSVSLKTIYAEFKRAPLGLVREAQHLILAALVAQRQIEFVTSKGDRINSRSLDLKIIWDDIVGISRPKDASYSIEKLNRWAAIFTGEGKFTSLNTTSDRETLMNSFAEWNVKWIESAILDRFAALPDEILNNRIWQIASRVNKKLGTAAECIRSASEDQMSLEECLDRIVETFSDDPDEMTKAHKDVEILDNFMKGVAMREKTGKYLAICESTGDDEIEQLRDKLVRIMDLSYSDPTDANNREMGYLWEKFQKNFAGYYVIQHEMVMKSHEIQEKFDEIRRSDKWWEFENLSTLSFFDPHFHLASKNILNQFSHLDCSFDVREALKNKPFCMCSFSLSKIAYWERLPQTFWETIGMGLDFYRQTLMNDRQRLTINIENLGTAAGDAELSEAATRFAAVLRSGQPIPQLSIMDLKILRTLASENKPAASKKNSPADADNFDEPRREMFSPSDEDWSQEIPDDAVFMNR